MARRFDEDYSGIGQLLHDPGLAGQLRARAEQVTAAARSAAPVASGAYRDSIGVEMVSTDRVTARVVADVPHALAVEFATRTLGRALDAAGGG